MCDLVTGGALGLGLLSSAGGAMANSAAADAENAARRNALLQNLREQQAFDQESNAITAKERGRFDNTQGQMDARKQQVADMYKANTAALPAEGVNTGVIPASSSNITVQEGKKQNDKVAAFSNQQSDALANLRSFGDVLGEANRGLSQDRSNLANVGSFRMGSNNVLPVNLEAASHAGDGMKSFADILGGVGNVATMVGLTGGAKGLFANTPTVVDRIGTGTGYTY